VTKRDTWMPLYIGDYLADTSRLSTEQHGAYLLLLMDYWRNGPPPNDDDTLASICKLTPAQWRRHAPLLMTFFDIEDGLLIQRRAEDERLKAGQISGKRKAAGKAGADKRWGKGGGKPIANAMAKASQSDRPSQSQETTSLQETAHAVSACEAVGKALETGGVAAEDINLADPVLVELVNQGATPAEFEGLAKEAIRKGKRSPFAWTLVVLQQRRAEAAGVTLAQRPEDAPDAWMGTRAGIEAKAATVGLPPWNECEQWPQYRARVLKAAGFEPRRVA
jgi:uncharacterized protein YdaU (DUF1376 family)